MIGNITSKSISRRNVMLPTVTIKTPYQKIKHNLIKMSTSQKFWKLMNDNLVFIVGIPMIISVHWGWSKLQEVPELVPEGKRELPIVTAAKYLYNTTEEKVHNIIGEEHSGNEEAQQK